MITKTGWDVYAPGGIYLGRVYAETLEGAYEAARFAGLHAWDLQKVIPPDPDECCRAPYKLREEA